MQAISELSRRIGLISESSTMKVAAEAGRLKREGFDVVDFSAGEPDFPTPDNIKQAAISAIHNNFTRYTPAGGTPELKEAICERHRADFGTDYKPSECVVAVGGKQAIFNLMQVLVNPGDEVIIPVPYWVTYNDVVCFAEGKPVFVETDEQNGFALTAEMVERHITPKTKMVIVNSPCNPSGAVLPREEFERIFHVTRKRGIWLMTDECYCQFLYEGSPFSVASLAGAKDNVIVCGSLSKTYAMTGWRIGFTLSPAPVAKALNMLMSQSTSNPNSIAQKAAVEALRGPQDSVSQMLREYRTRRDYVVKRLRAIPGIAVNEPQGAFYAYPNVSAVFGNGVNCAMEFASRLLSEEFVATVPGEAFGSPKFIRISYAASMKNLERGLDRLERFVAKLRG